MPCIFCRSTQDLTEEHLFPAFCGGVLTVHDASCGKCNKGKCNKFENRIAAGTRPMRNVLEIEDRYGDVPDSQVTFAFGGLVVPAKRTGDGDILLTDYVAKALSEDGKTIKRGLFRSPETAEKFSEKARKRGERVNDVPVARDLTIEPISEQSIEFAFTPEMKQLVAKIALVGLAYRYGTEYALGSQFDKLRESIFVPTLPVHIFANPYFADNQTRTPMQHSISTYLSAGMHHGWSVITMFGGLSYLVYLTDSFHERESRSFSIHYDIGMKRECNPIVLMDEYNLIGRIQSDSTKFDSVDDADEQWFKIVEPYCKAKGLDIFRSVSRP
jgi:hypothetical protein